MEMSDQLHSPATLSLGKEPPVPIVEETEWTPEPVWIQGQREKIPLPSMNRTPSRPARSLVTILTELSRLLNVRKFYLLFMDR
jgi:hypothetical protein